MFLLNVENVSPFTFKDRITSPYIHHSNLFLSVAITLLLTCNNVNEMPKCTWDIPPPNTLYGVGHHW